MEKSNEQMHNETRINQRATNMVGQASPVPEPVPAPEKPAKDVESKA